MDIDRLKQLAVIAETNRFLQITENTRRQIRFQKGLADLENNRLAILKNQEFVDKLIEHLFNLYHQDDRAIALDILAKIGGGACSLEQKYREQAVFILVVFAEKISREKQPPEYLEAISRILVDWLKSESELLAGFDFICAELQKILHRMLAMGLWHQTENLVILLSQIRSGILTKKGPIRKMITKVHSSLADKATLRTLVEVYLDPQEDRRDIAKSLLTHLGTRVSSHLIETLMQTKEREKRFALLELIIPTTGRSTIPVLDRCLAKDPPWFVIRNVIMIISRMGDPDLYAKVRPYLDHNDIRVQQQVLNCISKLGGNRVRERLIEALYRVNDELKQQVVIQLGNMGGAEVGEAFCSLLERRSSGFMKYIDEDLLVTLCTKIKFIPSQRAIDAMRALIAKREQLHDDRDRVLLSARDALVSLELKYHESNRHLLSSPKPSSDQPSPPSAPEMPDFDTLPDGDSGIQAGAEPAADDGEHQISEEPAADSRNRNAIVEKHQVDPIAVDHFNIWSELYEQMSTKEFTAFHAALNHRTFAKSELIVTAGDIQAPLFFFDRGSAALSRLNREGEESYFSPIRAGDMIGSDVFLTGDAWNLSLVAGEETTAHIFDLEDLLQLQIDHPYLAEKLFSYCAQHDVLPSLLRVLDETGTERGEHANLHRDGMIGFGPQSAETIEENGIILKKLVGGLCFSLHVRADEQIADLLENELRLGIRLSTGIVRSFTATIIGVVRIASRNNQAIIFARFSQPLNDSAYRCENIEFPESV